MSRKQDRKHLDLPLCICECLFCSDSSLECWLTGSALVHVDFYLLEEYKSSTNEADEVFTFGETARVQGDGPDSRAHLPDPIVSLQGGNTLERWSFKSEPQGLLLSLQERARNVLLQQRGCFFVWVFFFLLFFFACCRPPAAPLGPARPAQDGGRGAGSGSVVVTPGTGVGQIAAPGHPAK